MKVDQVVNSDNIITGMNKFFLILWVLVSCSGCMALAPKPGYPVNLIEEDLIGTWEYYQGKAIPIIDLKSKNKNIEYKDARLIIKLNRDHSYEEILIRKDKQKVFRSNWHFSYFDDGKPNVQIEDTRYVPEDAYPSAFPIAIEVDTEDKHQILLCYPHDPDESSRCFEKQ